MSLSLDLLAFGAHPDDLEFGAGGILAVEAAQGRKVHAVIGSRGEAGTHGTPEMRTREAEAGATALGITCEFIDLGGDAHFEVSVARAIQLARLLRHHRPRLVLAPTLDENQHPDHVVLAKLVRDACRLARFGGLAELRDLAPHAIEGLFHYAITSSLTQSGDAPLLIDITPAVATWTKAMEAHVSQAATRDYVDLQLTRAKVTGARAGVAFAQPLWPSDPLVATSLSAVGRTARRF